MKQMIALFLAGSMLGCEAGANTAFTGMRDKISAFELVAEMAPGANLWNTLDAVCGSSEGLESETCWGNPRTTLEMITDISNRGFKTLRIPVTWYNHMGPAPDYEIKKEWMDRVEEVANYAFANGMYVIINIHHDDYHHDKEGSWLSPTYERKDKTIDQIQKVWKQIATRFKEYGDFLIFETMNEPRETGVPHEWTGGNAENRDMVNQLNLAAVNAIRATGGNNATRFIMVPPVGANGGGAGKDLIIPNNDKRVLVSVHNYGPWSFTLQKDGVDTWGKPEEYEALDKEIKFYHDEFISQGQAVILGEWGAGDKKNIESRTKYYEAFAAACKKYQVTPIAWIYSYDRKNRKWKHPSLEAGIFKAFGEEGQGLKPQN